MSSRLINQSSEVNVLADVLDTLRFRGSIFFRSKLAAPWGMSLEKMENPRFHIALSGDCFIGVGEEGSNVSKKSDDKIISIKHMDIVMLPYGEMHWIADQPDRKLTPSVQASDACELGMPLFQQGEITNSLICGLIDYDKDIVHPILSALPSVMHFSDISDSDPIWMTVMLINSEMGNDALHHTSIIDRLTEVLFMQLLNQYMENNSEMTGFFAAMRDRRIHRALELIHMRPEYPWTLDLLSEEVNMSRATLIRHFNETVGLPPMSYISNWRMTKAYHLIRHTTNTLEYIAEQVGFSSSRTLTKSFSRHFGLTPSEIRNKENA